MSHEGCPTTHSPKDHSSGEKDIANHGEHAPGPRNSEPDSLLSPGKRRHDEPHQPDECRHSCTGGTDALFQLTILARMLEIRAQGVDRSHAFNINDAYVHSTVSTHLENPRMFSRIKGSIFRRQGHMIAGRTWRRRFLPIASCTAGHVIHRPKYGKIGGSLIATPERRDIALETPVQLQTERRGNDHVPGPLVLADVKMARIEINGEKDGIWKGRPECFENEQSIVRIRSKNADGVGPFSFILNPRSQRAHIIELTGAFRTFPQPACQYILGSHVGFGVLSTPGVHTVTARHFTVKTAEIAIPED